MQAEPRIWTWVAVAVMAVALATIIDGYVRAEDAASKTAAAVEGEDSDVPDGPVDAAGNPLVPEALQAAASEGDDEEDSSFFGLLAAPPMVDPLANTPMVTEQRPDKDGEAAEASSPTQGLPAAAKADIAGQLAVLDDALVRGRDAMTAQLTAMAELERKIEAHRKLLGPIEVTPWEERAKPITDKDADGSAADQVVTPIGVASPEVRLGRVVQILKKMKPKAAAKLFESWADPLAVDVLGRLPARTASPILAAMPPKLAARIASKLARAGFFTPAEGVR